MREWLRPALLPSICVRRNDVAASNDVDEPGAPAKEDDEDPPAAAGAAAAGLTKPMPPLRGDGEVG